MKNKILQICLSERHSDFLLNVEQYVRKFGNSSDSKHLSSLILRKQDNGWNAYSPITSAEKWIKNSSILTLEYLLDLPVGFLFSDNGKSLPNIIQDEYDRHINIEDKANIDNNLHLIIHIADNDNESIEAFNFLIQSLPQNLSGHIKIHTIVYSSKTNLGKQISNNLSSDVISQNIEKISEIRKSIIDKNQLGRAFFISNYNELGLCLNLSRKEDLGQFVGRTLIYLLNSYQSLTLQNANIEDLTAIGIYGKEINKTLSINNNFVYLLSLILNSFIGNPGVSNKIQDLFSNFIASTQSLIKENFETDSINESKIKSNILDFIKKIRDSEDLTLREKTELLSRFQRLWSQDNLEIENTKDDYTYEDIYMPILLESGIDTPYPEVKELITQIKIHNKNIKIQEEKLQELSKFLPPLQQNCFWTEDGIKIGETIYKLNSIVPNNYSDNVNIKEYSPSIRKLPVSSDIRSRFSKIKSQGNQGSCVSFSLVSIVEYYLNSALNKEDLSEAFLYYTAREITNDTFSDKGVSVENAIKSLQTQGVCVESLCPYDEKIYDRKPSPEAYEDAQKRCISSAEKLNNNIRDIKSALSEGYPIIASFRVFKSLEKNTDGFISLPSENELSEPEQFHAMVICGYNDANKYFIVRNSWGTQFGKNGYCYLPYGYIRDKELTRSLYIVRVKDTPFEKYEVISDTDDPTEYSPRFHYEVNNNKIIEEKVVLEDERKSLNEKLTKLKTIIFQIVSQTDLNAITVKIDNELKQLKQSLNEKKDLLEASSSKQNLSAKRGVIISIITLLASVVLFIVWLNNKNRALIIPPTILFISSIAGFAFSVFRFYNSKGTASQLQNEIKDIELQVQNLEKKKVTAKLAYEKLQTLLLILSKIDTSINKYDDKLSNLVQSFDDWYKILLSENIRNDNETLKNVNIKEEVHRLAKYIFDPKGNSSLKSKFYEYQLDLLKRLNDYFDESVKINISDKDMWMQFLEKFKNTTVTTEINGLFSKRQRLTFMGDLEGVPNIEDLNIPNSVIQYKNPLLMFGIIEKNFAIDSLQEISL